MYEKVHISCGKREVKKVSSSAFGVGQCFTKVLLASWDSHEGPTTVEVQERWYLLGEMTRLFSVSIPAPTQEEISYFPQDSRPFYAKKGTLKYYLVDPNKLKCPPIMGCFLFNKVFKHSFIHESISWNRKYSFIQAWSESPTREKKTQLLFVILALCDMNAAIFCFNLKLALPNS